jgi:hypothetical protein
VEPAADPDTLTRHLVRRKAIYPPLSRYGGSDPTAPWGTLRLGRGSP